jgi:hypothetical protein
VNKDYFPGRSGFPPIQAGIFPGVDRELFPSTLLQHQQRQEFGKESVLMNHTMKKEFEWDCYQRFDSNKTVGSEPILGKHDIGRSNPDFLGHFGG